MKLKKKAAKPLDPAHIAAAALKLIEANGLYAFSMRKLAAELGCEAMSLYHYYPSKLQLMNAIVDSMVQQIHIPEHALGFRKRLTAIALSYRALSARYPNFAIFFITHRFNTPITLAFLERLVTVFTDEAKDAETAARVFRIFGYYINGAVLDETAGYARGPGEPEPLPPEEQARIAPTVVHELSPFFKSEHWEATFMRGLNVLIDAVERGKA